MTSDNKSGQRKERKLICGKALLAPLVGFLSLYYFDSQISICSPNTLIRWKYHPSLSLIYIGIVLAEAGLNTITFSKDTIVTLVGRFILSSIMFLVLILCHKYGDSKFKTFMIQSIQL